MGKCPNLEVRLHIEIEDDPERHKQLLKMIILALDIMDLDEQASIEYQKAYLKNL